MVRHWFKKPRVIVVTWLVVALLLAVACGTAAQPETAGQPPPRRRARPSNPLPRRRARPSSLPCPWRKPPPRRYPQLRQQNWTG
jgi:hypothetical protein